MLLFFKTQQHHNLFCFPPLQGSHDFGACTTLAVPAPPTVTLSLRETVAGPRAK